MFPFDRHERLQRDLSAYADGELSAGDTARVAAHLELCEDCVVLLQGLRDASALLAATPQVEAPRSFALTPEMAGAPSTTPAARTWPAYASGLRYATAGLAVALAVVLVADRGNFGDNTDSQSAQVQEAAARASDTLAAAESASEYLSDADGQADTASGAPQATGVPGAAAPGDDVPARSSEPPVAAGGETDDKTNLDIAPDSDTATGEQDRVGTTDGGVDALTILEVALATLLGASIVGVAAAWLRQRKRSG